MGRLFFARLQKEGELQVGDEVHVDGEPATVCEIKSMDTIVAEYPNGDRVTCAGIEFPPGTTLGRRAPKPG